MQLGRRDDAVRILKSDRRARGRADGARAPASRSGGARARRVSGRQRVLPSGQSPGAHRRRREHRVGRAVPREVRPQGSDASRSRTRSRRTRRTCPRSSAWRASRPRRTRPRRRRRSSGRSRSIPTPCPRTCSPRRWRSTTASATRRATASQRALKVNPEQPRGALARGGDRLPRRQDDRVRHAGPAGPEDQPGLRRGVPRRRRSRRAQLPLR